MYALKNGIFLLNIYIKGNIMKKIVKFGGSSLADATQFKKVVKIIKSVSSNEMFKAFLSLKHF